MHRGLTRAVAEQLSMLPVGLIIDLSLVRRIDADRLEARAIAATLAGESDIAFWARSRCIQSVRRRGRGSAPGAPRSAATDSAGSTWGSVLTSLGRPYYPPRETARTE